jgi:uncharacterized protein
VILRSAHATIDRVKQGYPIVALIGPRQSGKSTLAKMAFPDFDFVNLENPQKRQFALEDPEGFLNQFNNGVILDEVQNCPDLFSYLQVKVDKDPQMGRYILTGSQQFQLVEKISQSLSGRVSIIELLPFSLTELKSASQLPTQMDEVLFKGMYPPLYDRNVSVEDWFTDYVKTYLERDVRSIINVKDLSSFQRFIKLCAARSGQLLQISDLAADAGLKHETTKGWLSILEATYVIFLLNPHHENFSKRLVKKPKLYFYDTGLASFLLGIRSPKELSIHASRGHLFEGWVISEFKKHFFNRHRVPPLYFWRDSKGCEIDLIIEAEGKYIGYEIKSGQTINSDFFSNLKKWQKLAQSQSSGLYLRYGGEESYTREQIQIQSWNHDVLGTVSI